MLKYEFIKEIKSKSICIHDYNRMYRDLDNEEFGWKMPDMQGAHEEGTREYYERYFLEEYCEINMNFPQGKTGHIHLSGLIENTRDNLIDIVYSKTGKMAVLQYIRANGKNEVVHLFYTSNRGWEFARKGNKNTQKFVNSIPVRKDRGFEYLVCFSSKSSPGVSIVDNEVKTPADGFTVYDGTITEFLLLEESKTRVKGHLKTVVNGVMKENIIVDVLLENGETYTKRVNVEEDWWGLHLPDVKIPCFEVATPYNTVIHEHLEAPLYAGKDLWIPHTWYNKPDKYLVNVGGTWIPVDNPNDWDVGGLLGNDATKELELYLSLK